MAATSRPPRSQASQTPREKSDVRASDAVRDALERAPLDDEPTTDEDRAALAEGRAARVRGDVVTTEELRRQLKL